MKVSYNWLSSLVDLKGLSPQALADLLTSKGLEVEEIENQGRGFEKVVTGHILDKGKHPNSDRLSFCKVDTGNAGGVLEIVCGATNHKTGDKVAVAMVGAELPNGMKIGKGKIRDVESNGMLCSEAELGLSKESAGIIILPPSTEIGQPVAQVLGRNDTLLTLKIYANQGHYLSHFGVAREIAAALGSTLKKPESKVNLDWKGSPISIELKAGDKAPQFFGCFIEGVKIGPSPRWLVERLEAVGSRSINNVVDVTNYVMLELGHPVHAYDADKIALKKIGVRLSKNGEKLPLLDSTQVVLGGTELVIFDGSDSAIGLAGVMGGGNSEVSDSTTKLFLECAEFDSVLVRRAKVKHNKMTDAATRFERGIDPHGLSNVMNRMTTLILEIAGGKVVGSTRSQVKEPAPRKSIEMAVDFVQKFIGIDISEGDVKKSLEALECKVEKVGANFKVTPPTYRLDLNIREDLSEEVARSVGYDKIPSTVPPLSGQPTPKVWDAQGSESVLLDRAKDAWVKQGLCETLNYGFTSLLWLSQFGMKSALKVQNPLSEEHEWMVPSLVPGLIQNALTNQRHHFGSDAPVVRLFEIRPTFQFKGEGVPSAPNAYETGISEEWKVAFLVAGPKMASGLKADLESVDLFDAKAAVEGFLDQMGAKGIRMIPIYQSRTPDHPVSKILHPGQSIEVLAGNQVLGRFGLLHPGVSKKLKLKNDVYVGEFDWNVLKSMSQPASKARTYKAWGEFPPMERDFAILVAEGTTSDQITGCLLKAGKPLVRSARVFDVYRGAQVPAGKISIAARVILQDDSRSLTEAEAEAASAKMIAALKAELSAELR